MRETHLPFWRGPKADNLIQRQEYLQLMLESHLRWIHETNDPDLKMVHGALIEALQGVIHQYNLLLDQLRKQG